MDEKHDRRRGGARRWLLIVGAWTVVETFFAMQNVVGAIVQNRPVDWYDAVALEYLYMVPWILLTPLLLRLVRRWRLERGWRPRAAHAVAAAPIAVVQAAAAYALTYAAALPYYPAERTDEMRADAGIVWVFWSFTAYWKYWAVVAILSALLYRRELRERETEAARLEAQLANARLAALRMRLQPHFLFNTLHSISMLNLKDADAANRLLVRLSDLLRATLATAEDAFVPLERELSLVDRYLEIEAIRIGERLRTTWDVDGETVKARVPTLVLQPLVENAIRHGIAPVSAAGRLAIRARKEGGVLVLEVEDDGPGLRPGFVLGRDAGVGLGTTQARLERLYGPEYGLALEPGSDGGLRARIRLPFEPWREGEGGG